MAHDIYAMRAQAVLSSAYPAYFMEQIRQTDIKTWSYFKGMDDTARFVLDGSIPNDLGVDDLPSKFQTDKTVQERAESLNQFFPFDPSNQTVGYKEYHEGMDDTLAFILHNRVPAKYVSQEQADAKGVIRSDEKAAS